MEVRVDGQLVVVVVDANGVSIVDAENGDLVAVLNLPGQIHIALFVVQHLYCALDSNELKALGFEISKSRSTEYYEEIHNGGWSR